MNLTSVNAKVVDRLLHFYSISKFFCIVRLIDTRIEGIVMCIDDFTMEDTVEVDLLLRRNDFKMLHHVCETICRDALTHCRCSEAVW